MAKVKQMKYRFKGDEWDNVSELAKDLIRKCLVTVDDRLSSKDILKHEWF